MNPSPSPRDELHHQLLFIMKTMIHLVLTGLLSPALLLLTAVDLFRPFHIRSLCPFCMCVIYDISEVVLFRDAVHYLKN